MTNEHIFVVVFISILAITLFVISLIYLLLAVDEAKDIVRDFFYKIYWVKKHERYINKSIHIKPPKKVTEEIIDDFGFWIKDNPEAEPIDIFLSGTYRYIS